MMTFDVIELLQATGGMTNSKTLQKMQDEYARLYLIERTANEILNVIGEELTPTIAWLDDLATVCDRRDIPEGFYMALSDELRSKEEARRGSYGGEK